MTNNKIINIPLLTSIFLIFWVGACQASSNQNNSDSQVVLPSPPSTLENDTNNSLALNQTCTNNNIGYQVSYPQDWQTNSGKVIERCQVFDPRSATVPLYTESTDKAIYLRGEKNVSFESIAKEDLGEEHLSSKTVDLANNHAVVIESKSTGKALLSKGIRKYSYIVDLGNKTTLIATTYDISGNNYQKNKQILDRMMKTIQFEQQLVQK